uniref:N-acetylglucosamine-6-phosphate deacetylase n=1 Tax=Timema tahoe TaxID=61484 RepID=A0A7R9NX21_9NEOP|nr:unnamed protein product [Timema tahoe]
MNSTKDTLLKFKNCRLLRDDRIIDDDIWVRDGKIVNPEKVFYDEKCYADEEIDCKGALISPGFIELQINGAFGVDFSRNLDDVESGLLKVAKGLLAHGITAFCPTVVTSPTEVYLRVLPHLKKRTGGSHGATVLGVHIEGPFINVEKKGAHPPKYIKPLDKGFETVLDMYGSLDNVCILTLAPELENALPIIHELTSRGITVSLGKNWSHWLVTRHASLVIKRSKFLFCAVVTNCCTPRARSHKNNPKLRVKPLKGLFPGRNETFVCSGRDILEPGHSVANLRQGEEAVAHGANFITHLFNAMLPFHHRDPGLVGLLASKQIPRIIYYGIITDGIHTHPAAIRIAHWTHPQGLVIVTDAISAMGLEEGTHTIGQMKVEVRGDRAVVAGTDTLCGSITTMDKCLRVFKKATGCSLVTALNTATLHPARTIGIHASKGTLDYGADADFVFLDDDLNVWSTWIAGNCVYYDSNFPQTTVKVINEVHLKTENSYSCIHKDRPNH